MSLDNTLFSDAVKKMYPLEETVCIERNAAFKGDKFIEKNGLLSKSNLDPKLVQVAQLFVQDLINRARLEVQRKNPQEQEVMRVNFLDSVPERKESSDDC